MVWLTAKSSSYRETVIMKMVMPPHRHAPAAPEPVLHAADNFQERKRPGNWAN